MAFKEVKIEELSFNPFTKISKEWMLITAGDEEKHNTMTASWGGVGIMWGMNVATAYIRPQRYTKEFVDAEEMFTLSFFKEDYRKALNLCGSKSGRECDKDKEAGSPDSSSCHVVKYVRQCDKQQGRTCIRLYTISKTCRNNNKSCHQCNKGIQHNDINRFTTDSSFLLHITSEYFHRTDTYT